MEKHKKEISEEDVLAAIFKVKPTPEMPRPGAQPSKRKGSKEGDHQKKSEK
jgi:hypothetical protein